VLQDPVQRGAFLAIVDRMRLKGDEEARGK